MLVKLGNIWVDPSKVEGVALDGGRLVVVTVVKSYYCGEKLAIDNIASIVNASLQTQSFGGEPNEEQKNDTNP